MNTTYVFEKGISRSSAHEYEKDVARRWWALPLDVSLPLTNGESYQLIYAGRPGSSTGPDIRDAILSFSHARARLDDTAGSDGDYKTTGDVEIHIRATDWFAHQHHTDKRYNNVVLHIVLICDNSEPTLPIVAKSAWPGSGGWKQRQTSPGTISAFCPLCKKRNVGLEMHVCNQIAFRWVPWHRASGKNATEFKSCAIRNISCFESCSLMCMKRTAVWDDTPVSLQKPSAWSRRESSRQDGTVIPTCSLNDMYPTTRNPQLVQWPCQHLISQLDEKERFHLFSLAGTLRFEMKAQIFFELLSNARSSVIFSAYDVCLIPALAEGMGFGRDRAFFRAAGLHLIGEDSNIPEPLGRSTQPSSLDKHRLQMLRILVENWRKTGAWELFRQILLPVPQDSSCLTPNQNGASVLTRQLAELQLLRKIFQELGTARADILICNVVLPFAAAVAQREDSPALTEAARNLYKAHPGLPSNQITRAMCKQLLLNSEPKGACQQQGLHHIYAQTCREKRCQKVSL